MTKVTLKVPKLSGFDKSFQNLLTTQCGTLTPILTDEVIPNTKVHLKTAINASLPPLASDTFMRCNLKLESYFVPSRLLYGGFVSWLTGEKVWNNLDGDFQEAALPRIMVGATTAETDLLQAGTLADYLGVRTMSSRDSNGCGLNIFPFLAYHRIYDDWYRNPLVQAPVFGPVFSNDTPQGVTNLPYSCYNAVESYHLNSPFPDGVYLGELRQRNFGFDPFTTALPTPQFGQSRSFTINMDSTDPNHSNIPSFTIASIRAANSLEQFSERHSLAGPRLQDWVKANYNADLSSGVAQRCILLGSAEVPVYSKGIYQQSNNSEFSDFNNPFSTSVGAEFGSAVCTGQVELIKDFTANEPGYIMVLASLVPKVTYSSGIDPMLRRYVDDSQYYQAASGNLFLRTDMANPLLQNVGNEPIFSHYLTGNISNDAYRNAIFGYQERFGFWKTKFDELHGLVRDGKSLESFALQRTVIGSPTIGAEFLEIPTDYLDQISATSTEISQYGCWIDCYHDYKVAMPLAEYSIPSLQDPAYEHGDDVEVTIGGSRL